MELRLPTYAPNLTSLFYRLVTMVWLIAIALFVLGPPVGSIDVDNDGNPDVAVVVFAPQASDVFRMRGQNDDLQNTQTLVATSLRLPRQKDNFQIVAHDGRAVLHSCCVLRC